MRVVALPYSGTAYTASFYASVAARGPTVVAGVWAARWLSANLGPDDVLHIHWPSHLYGSSRSVLTTIGAFLKFAVLLSMVRLRTRHIWWTAHNLLPHDRCAIPLLDTLARQLTIRMASVVFVHGAAAAAILAERFPASAHKIVQIPHGNWIGYYLPEMRQCAARIRLGLPRDSFVYLSFGYMKRYKNLKALLAVFREIPDPDAVLLIAGRFLDPRYHSEIVEMAGHDPRVRIDAGWIPDGLVSTYLAASSVMCVPYTDILTSGTTMLAMSYGRPTVTIDRGFAGDVITDSTGLLVGPGDDEGLARALRAVRERTWEEQEIIQRARCFTFDEAASILVARLPSGPVGIAR